jgi:protein-tyrosine phosphatase
MAAKFAGPVFIFDLRQEDHGFVNGDPVSWSATNNWANVGKSHDEIVAEERSRLVAIRPGATITLSDDKQKKGTGEADTKTEVVSSVSSEEELAASFGFRYVRITVSDHCRPTDLEVDRFVEAVRAMPPDAWAHFHCRAGKGRTTTFMALYDMLRNAPSVSLTSIVNRQSLLIGDYDLLSKSADAGPKAGVAEDRAAFVRAFYDYAKANPGGRPLLWTQWLKAQP